MSSRAVAVTLVAATASLAAGCGNGAQEDKKFARFARSISAAYHCMPAQTRRRYDRLGRGLERVGAPILQRNLDRPAQEQDRALRASPEYMRLNTKASRLLARYLPRGSDYDPTCYRRESERHDRRIGSTR